MEIVEIDGVVYEIKSRSRYSWGFSYCSKCSTWWRRVDGEKIFYCPSCKVQVRRDRVYKEKKYINILLDEKEE